MSSVRYSALPACRYLRRQPSSLTARDTAAANVITIGEIELHGYGVSDARELSMGLGKIIGRVAATVGRMKSGDYYKMGFDDARAGRGKDRQIIMLKSYRNIPGRDEGMNQFNDALVGAYEDGYRDGMAREEIEARREQWRHYPPRD